MLVPVRAQVQVAVRLERNRIADIGESGGNCKVLKMHLSVKKCRAGGGGFLSGRAVDFVPRK